MGARILALACLLACGCHSPKAAIGRAADRTDGHAAAISEEASSGAAELRSVLGVAVEGMVMAALRSCVKRFEAIGAHAAEIRSDVQAVRDELPGVKDIGWSWKTKLLVGLSVAGLAFFALSRMSMLGSALGLAGGAWRLLKSLWGRVRGK